MSRKSCWSATRRCARRQNICGSRAALRSISRAPPRSPRSSPAACAPKAEGGPAPWFAAPAPMALSDGRANMTDTSAERAAASVDEKRLWQRHMAMAKLGATPRGGVRRLALDANDNEARRVLVEWARGLGFTAALDPVGNLFIRREGSAPDAEPVVSGSHTDTQPSGGKFDGIYGVLAACEALEAIERAGITTRRPLEAGVWTFEEGGARLPMGAMGSGGFVGLKTLADILQVKDDAGVTVDEALKATRAALPGVPARPLGFPVAAFLEAHIEQGPELEAKGDTIGIVTRIQGARRFIVEVDGEDAPGRTTSRARRQATLYAAVAMVSALEKVFHDDLTNAVRFIGR